MYLKLERELTKAKLYYLSSWWKGKDKIRAKIRKTTQKPKNDIEKENKHELDVL